jgi:hypothetical protein
LGLLPVHVMLLCRTIEYAVQHTPALNGLTSAAILSCFQGLVNAAQRAPLPINTDQHNPIMAAAN